VNRQLRVYTIKPGRLEDWLDEWNDHIRPLRDQFGFMVLGPWLNREERKFVWILGHEEDWETADASYYASPARKALDPDPARHLASAEHLQLEDP
jgi:hypothetical protein